MRVYRYAYELRSSMSTSLYRRKYLLDKQGSPSYPFTAENQVLLSPTQKASSSHLKSKGGIIMKRILWLNVALGLLFLAVRDIDNTVFLVFAPGYSCFRDLL